MRYTLYILLLLLIFQSCKYFDFKKQDEEIIASVGSNHLYKSDLKKNLKNTLNAKDSAIITQNFIENWARKQIIIQKAAFNLSDEKKEEFNKMVEEYKNDLYINSYKEAMLAQNLDTVVRSQEMQAFYDKNKAIFKLKEEILQYKYVILNKDINIKLRDFDRYFRTHNSSEIDSLLYQDFKYFVARLNDSVWYSYKDFILQHEKFKTLNKNQVLKPNFFTTIQDDENYYFIHVKDVKNKGEMAPMDYVAPDIRQMLLHKKQLEYIKELDHRLIEEAIENNVYKRYY